MNNTGSTVDTDRTRRYETEDGVFLISFTDPHGYWFIRREQGQIPEHLKGAYTQVDYAKKAIDSYLASKPEPRVQKVKLTPRQPNA